jgi:DNA polymerase
MMREEVLKELELWPVWTLREPLAPQPKALETMPEESVQIERGLVEVAKAAPSIETQTFLSFQTEAADCLVLHQDRNLSQEEEQLWLNICKAMQFSQKMHTQHATISALLAHQRPKVMIIFGEEVAQNILPQVESFSENLQSFQNIPCVVTFSLAHLLQHPLDKGKTWRSLCQALALLN